MNVKGWTAGYHNDGTALLSKLPWTREMEPRGSPSIMNPAAMQLLHCSVDTIDTIDTIDIYTIVVYRVNTPVPSTQRGAVLSLFIGPCLWYWSCSDQVLHPPPSATELAIIWQGTFVIVKQLAARPQQPAFNYHRHTGSWTSALLHYTYKYWRIFPCHM